ELEELSVSEIARRTGVSLATASARVRVARRACARALRRRQTTGAFRLGLLLPWARSRWRLRWRWPLAVGGGALMVVAALALLAARPQARGGEGSLTEVAPSQLGGGPRRRR